MDNTDIDINNVVDDQNDSNEDHEDLPSDVADAIGIRKKKDNRPPPDDYVSELENPDLESEEDI